MFAAYEKSDALNFASDKLKGDSDFIKAISTVKRPTIAQHPWTDTLTNEYTHAAMNVPAIRLAKQSRHRKQKL